MFGLARKERIFKLLLLVAISVPFLVGALQIVADNARAPLFLFGDQALIDVNVHRALEGLQLTGVYSRFGWNHPGPIAFFFYSPGVFLLGDDYGIYFGALLTNWFFALASVGVLLRYTRVRTAAAITLALLIFLYAQGPFALRDPWNPAIVVLPLVLAMVALAVRPTVLSLSLVSLGCSFAFQSHIGTVSVVAPIVATLVLVHLVGYVVSSTRWLRGGEGNPLTPRVRSLVIVALVTVVAWLPPIIDQVTKGRDGNFARAIYFQLKNNGGERHTLTEAAQAVVGASWLPSSPTLLPPTEFPGSIWLYFLGWLAVAIVGAALAWRRRLREAFVLLLFSAVGLIVMTVANSRVTGAIEVYLLWWIPIPIVALLAGVLALMFGEDGLLTRTSRRWPTLLLTGVVLGWTIANASITLVGQPLAKISRIDVQVAYDYINANLGPREGTVGIEVPDGETGPYVAGVVSALIGDGHPVIVNGEGAAGYVTDGSDEPPVAVYRITKTGSGNDYGGEVLGQITGKVPLTVRVTSVTPSAS